MLQNIEPQGFFALAAAGQQYHGPRLGGAPGPTLRQLRAVGLDVELQVAENPLHRCPERAQALGVRFGLRPHRRQAPVGRTRQPAQALRFAQRGVVQARIGQHQGNALAAARCHQIRPNLGLHQDAQRRAELAQKALHGSRCVPGLPDLHVARLQQFGTFGTAGGRAVGQQQAHARQRTPQRGQQDGGSARFAQRDGMQPDEARFRRLAVAAEALFHRHGIAGLGHGAAAQLAAQQRLGCPGQGAVKPAHGAVSVQRCPPVRRASHAPAARTFAPRCAAAPLPCGPRSAAPILAWCCSRGSGRSRRANPRAVRRWC